MFQNFILACVLLSLFGCASKSYVFQPLDSIDIQSRALVQREDDVRVSASVPGAEETFAIFGFRLYDQGVQPVWLEIENNSLEVLRYAPSGTDREYFSPLEVAYKNRKGLSADARQAVNVRFHGLALKRHLEPGETSSGFVFTHSQPGTKIINVDLFGSERSLSFTFFASVPGFRPDHEDIEFENLYPAEAVRDITQSEVHGVIFDLPLNTSDSAGNPLGTPANVALVGTGDDILYSLIRAGWTEVSADESNGIKKDSYHYFGRKQDTVFRYNGKGRTDGFYELRLWLSPFRVDTTPLWLGQVRQFIDHPWIKTRPDPDIDDAQIFFVQNFWYSEVLLQFGIVKINDPESSLTSEIDFLGREYFTSGERLVLWVTDNPVSTHDVTIVDWEHLKNDR